MSFQDQWVTMAMADDTLVANQLLLLCYHHRPSVISHWLRRKPRSPRLPVNPTAPSPSKAVDKTETPSVIKRIRMKRTLGDLQQEHKLISQENKDLRDKLEAIYLTAEKERATAESIKKIKIVLKSRRTLQTAEAVVNEEPKSVEGECDTPNIGSEQTDEDQILEQKTPLVDESSPVCSDQREISVQKPQILLPDLNEPPEEYLAQFIGLRK